MKRSNAEIILLSFLFLLPLLVNQTSGRVEDTKFYTISFAAFLLIFSKWTFKKNWLWICSILILLIGLFTALASSDLSLSFLGSDKRQLGYLTWLAAIIIGLKTAYINEDKKIHEKVTNCLIFSGALTALAAMTLGNFELGLFDSRIGGTMGNPNALGELLCVTIFLTFTKIRDPKYLALLLLQLPAFIWSGNRMSWIALAISLTVYASFIKKNLKLGMLTFLIIIGISFFGYERFADTTSIQTRLDIYKSAVTVIADNPLGYGFDQIEEILTPEHFTLKADRAHQMYLDVAINMGLAGMLILIYMSIKTFVELLRCKEAAYTSLAFAFLTLVLSLQTSFFTVTHLALFFVLAGLAVRRN